MATTKITNPDLFDITANTALRLPSGTTEQRPTSPSTGEWRYNTTTNLIEFYDGADWRELQSEVIPPTPSEHFNTVLYTGTGSAQSITGVGFKPDWIWIKDRDTNFSHAVTDSTRGVGNIVKPNTTDAQSTDAQTITSFDADGFSLGTAGGSFNNNGDNYVAWCWKANGGTTSSNTDGTITSTVQVNTKAGFSIMRYTGNGTVGATIGHGLGAAPDLIISRNLTSATAWGVYHKYNTASPAGQRLKLDLPDLTLTTNDYWAGVEPTSTVLSVGTEAAVNDNTKDYIMYAFKAVAGYSAFGSYAGNASDDGPIINTGFEPAWLMIKVNTGSADGWFMVDNKRDTSNPRGDRLFANSDVAEASEPGAQVDFLTNGFQIRGTGAGQGQVNSSGSTYVYIAFASNPSTSPALNDSFANKTYSGNSGTQSITGLGFSPNFLWIKQRNGTEQNYLYDTIRGSSKYIHSNISSAQGTDATTRLTSFDSDGFSLGSDGAVNGSGSNYISWNWKANPLPTISTDGTIQSVVSANQAAGFSIVKFTTPSTNNFSVGHGLGVAPDLVIYKCLSQSSNWTVYDSISGATKYLLLNGSGAQQTDSLPFNDTEPTATVLNLGSATVWWATNADYIAYAFKSISGFSKIGTYTGSGSGSTQSINTGFAASWVIIKDYNVGGSWWIEDTDRGGAISLKANSSDAESTTNYVTFTSTGFDVTGGLNDNASGSKFIYMAFKENPTIYPVAGNMSFLVIAGGASGAVYHGGGGGAGGLRTSYGSTSGGGSSAESDITLAAGTYTITVGAGGTGVTYSSSNVAGNNGNDSSIAASGLTTITSIGGGGGSSYAGQTTPGNGGSGGGGGNGGQAGGTGTANQGNDGGTGSSSSSNYPSGGGGGAGAVGGNGSGSSAGNGGAGLSVSITGSSVAYAGGAGGSSFRGGTAGTGGTGGGANGTNADGTGNAGTTNTGGGGSGATAATSGAGGSGVIILRLLTSEYSSSTTGSPTVTTDGDYTVLTYTGSGTYVHS